MVLCLPAFALAEDLRKDRPCNYDERIAEFYFGVSEWGTAFFALQFMNADRPDDLKNKLEHEVIFHIELMEELMTEFDHCLDEDERVRIGETLIRISVMNQRSPIDKLSDRDDLLRVLDNARSAHPDLLKKWETDYQ